VGWEKAVKENDLIRSQVWFHLGMFGCPQSGASGAVTMLPTPASRGGVAMERG